jgi:hypothetical protein
VHLIEELTLDGSEGYMREYTVESRFKVSRFKVFPHLVFIFAVPAKAPYTQCINYPVLVFLDLRFFPHLVDENSGPT